MPYKHAPSELELRTVASKLHGLWGNYVLIKLCENIATSVQIDNVHNCLHAKAELSSCDIKHMAHKPKTLIIWPLRKSLLTLLRT